MSGGPWVAILLGVLSLACCLVVAVLIRQGTRLFLVLEAVQELKIDLARQQYLSQQLNEGSPVGLSVIDDQEAAKLEATLLQQSRQRAAGYRRLPRS